MPRWLTTEEMQSEADRQTASLAGLAVTLGVLVVCLFLIHQLHRTSAIEDCIMAGRLNCDLILLSKAH
ncbi:MAG TPA: hypothetical protein VGC80_14405 [Acetobacteraceae bacterium]|jgi:hypothetical protein